MYRTDELELTNDMIIEFVAQYEKDTKDKYKLMQDYYENKNEILKRTTIEGNDINNKLANNYAGYITDMATGYFIGRPVTYTTTKEDDLIDLIQDIYNYNDEQGLKTHIPIRGRKQSQAAVVPIN